MARPKNLNNHALILFPILFVFLLFPFLFPILFLFLLFLFLFIFLFVTLSLPITAARDYLCARLLSEHFQGILEV